MEESPITQASAVQSPYANHSDEQLESALEKALADENYELAAKIRDEITRRK